MLYDFDKCRTRTCWASNRNVAGSSLAGSPDAVC